MFVSISFSFLFYTTLEPAASLFEYNEKMHSSSVSGLVDLEPWVYTELM